MCPIIYDNFETHKICFPKCKPLCVLAFGINKLCEPKCKKLWILITFGHKNCVDQNANNTVYMLHNLLLDYYNNICGSMQFIIGITAYITTRLYAILVHTSYYCIIGYYCSTTVCILVNIICEFQNYKKLQDPQLFAFWSTQFVDQRLKKKSYSFSNNTCGSKVLRWKCLIHLLDIY